MDDPLFLYVIKCNNHLTKKRNGVKANDNSFDVLRAPFNIKLPIGQARDDADNLNKCRRVWQREKKMN